MLGVIRSGVQSATQLAVGQIPVFGPLLASTLEAAFAARNAMNVIRFQRHVESVFDHIREESDYLDERLDNLAAQVQDRLVGNDGAAVARIQWNYAEQAVKEPIDERARMLEHASAAIIDVGLTVAEHATVQRILQELNPEDALDMHLLKRVAGTIHEGEQHRSPDHLRWLIWNKCLGRDVLVSAGCIRVTYGGGGAGLGPGTGVYGEAAVTPLGKRMLRVLRSFLASRARADAPGRPLIQGSRSKEEARGVVGGAVWSEVVRVPLASYAYPKCGRTPKDLPSPTAKAMLRLFFVPPDRALRLAAGRTNDVVAQTMPELPVNDMAVTIEPMEGRDEKTVVLHGPHDVLRWLADDIDADWT